MANLLVFVAIAAAGSGVGYATYELDQIHRVPVHDLVPPSRYVTINGRKVKVASASSPPFTVLLIGSDSRAGAVNSGLGVGNATTNAENLSDSIILARVSPATDQLALLSIPRDLWVTLPGGGMGKINSAFSGGDPTRLVQVVENDLGIPVNHFASVSFDSFEQIADAIGGVEQYFPTSAVDFDSGLEVPTAGCVLLKGSQALAFVRSRHYQYIEPGHQPVEQQSPESDLGRIQRQQAFIKNAIAKIRREGILTHPTLLASLISSITKNLTVDQTFSDGQLISLARDFSNIDANSIPNSTYPVQNYNVDGVEALSGIPSADAAVVAQFESVGTLPASPSTQKKATTPTTTLTTVPHGTVPVEVENGSGAANQATQASTDLHTAGFTVTGLTDAPSYNYTANVIRYAPDGLAAARTLQAALIGGATLVSDPSLTGNNLTLITGAKWAGTIGSPSTGSTSTTTGTVPPATGTVYGSTQDIEADSSSFYKGVYIPPGREPGQAVETCGN